MIKVIFMAVMISVGEITSFDYARSDSWKKFFGHGVSIDSDIPQANQKQELVRSVTFWAKTPVTVMHDRALIFYYVRVNNSCAYGIKGNFDGSIFVPVTLHPAE